MYIGLMRSVGIDMEYLRVFISVPNKVPNNDTEYQCCKYCSSYI